MQPAANPRAVMGANLPPDPLMALALERIAAANRFITDHAEIKDEATSDRAGGFYTQVADVLDQLDKRRKAENNEWAAKQTEKYSGPLGMLAMAKDLINKRVKAYLAVKQAKLDALAEAERLAAVELQRKAEEAAAKALEEASRKGGQPLQAIAAAEALQEQAEAATAQAATPRPKARIQGMFTPRAITLKTSWRAKIVDEKAALKAYAKHPAVRAAALEAIGRLATADAIALKDKSRAAAGIEFYTEEK